MRILCSKTAQTTFRFVTKSEKNRGNLKKKPVVEQIFYKLYIILPKKQGTINQ